jgi:hypothetical protein
MYCGQRPPEVVLVVDHVVPVKEGGGDEAANLVTSCFNCNAGKGAVPLESVPPAFDEMAIAEAMQEIGERRIALKAQSAAVEQDRVETEEAVQCVYNWWIEEFSVQGADLFKPDSVRTWLRLGRPMSEMYNAIVVTRRKWERGNYEMCPSMLWPYLCGVMWSTIKGKHQR